MSQVRYPSHRSARRYFVGDYGYPAFHPTVLSWITHVVTNGGAVPSIATSAAASTFCYTLDANSLTAQMIALSIFAPDNLIAAITPLIANSGSNPWTNINTKFITADLTIDGLAGDASTKLLDSGLVGSATFSGSNAGISLYTSTLGSSSCTVDVSANSSVAAPEGFLAVVYKPTVDNRMYFDCGNNSAGRTIVTNTGWIGFTSANRTAINAGAVYMASSGHAFSTLGTNTNDLTGVNWGPQNICIFGNQSTGGYQSTSNRRFSFCALHHGLTSGQSQTLFNAVQALRISLGGGYV